jgi:hypothetical protein
MLFAAVHESADGTKLTTKKSLDPWAPSTHSETPGNVPGLSFNER